ncbi:dihydrofolate reductase family protein [Nonomuraea aurantiaca]|uniref:dihydrofolate reductase family protein n=1 Tax=Nonomuraea aurantiaca TaxID=2878562 RepID=UPI001CD96BE8|nr:dihydrofolate reductase family protein [Nonomuraea aurantiaca]MCA2219789.1 dihydrofolate reductase family protein [Nonomuraea aurantiaca]
MTTAQNAGRTVIGNILLSLDGRVSGPAGEYDMSWIVPHAISEGAREHVARITETATTVLLGRKNYQGFGGFWPSVANDDAADPRDRSFSRWLNTAEKVVFSSTLKEAPWENSRIVDAAPAEVIKDLRGQDGGDIVVLASGSVIKDLLLADELDRLSVILAPELVGGGARLFEDGLPSSSWRLASEVETTASGALCLFYDRVREGG